MLIHIRVAHQVLNSASIVVQAEKHVQVCAHHDAFHDQTFTDPSINRKDGIIRI